MFTGQNQVRQGPSAGLAYGGISGGSNRYAEQAECAKQAEEPRRASVYERIDRALDGAERSLVRAQAAQRAREILNKYPEFGELLDLLQQF